MILCLRFPALLVLALLTASCSSSRLAVENLAGPAPRELTDQIRLKDGDVVGRISEEGTKSYLGIPYAAPPIGALRWRSPAPVTPWAGLRDASVPGPQCMQPASLSLFYAAPPSPVSEDCLYLNVWSAAQTAEDRLPVMVWIHGGALVEGSGNRYPGEELAARGVILVTINYRLGPFGFFAHPELTAENDGRGSGNQGFMDQIAALRWVQANIAEFGGDPDNVTIFGESAGAWSVSVLQASPMARGLFHKVIGQSGSRFLPQWDLKMQKGNAPSAESWGRQLARKLSGVDNPSLEDLRKIPAAVLMNAYETDPALLWNFDALTIVDGQVLPEQLFDIFSRGAQARVPALLGSNQDEATPFNMAAQSPDTSESLDYKALFQETVAFLLPEAGNELLGLYPVETQAEARQSYFDFQTDVQFTEPMRVWADKMSTVSSPAYLYWWTWAPSVQGSRHLGAFHAAEVPYVFGLVGNRQVFGSGIDESEEDIALSNRVMEIWTNFAKTGNPSVKGLIDWPEYSPEKQEMVILDAEIEVAEGIRRDRSTFISKAYSERRAQ